MDVSLRESPGSLNGGRKAHPACEWRHSMVSHTKKRGSCLGEKEVNINTHLTLRVDFRGPLASDVFLSMTDCLLNPFLTELC